MPDAHGATPGDDPDMSDQAVVDRKDRGTLRSSQVDAAMAQGPRCVRTVKRPLHARPRRRPVVPARLTDTLGRHACPGRWQRNAPEDGDTCRRSPVGAGRPGRPGALLVDMSSAWTAPASAAASRPANCGRHAPGRQPVDGELVSPALGDQPRKGRQSARPPRGGCRPACRRRNGPGSPSPSCRRRRQIRARRRRLPGRGVRGRR